jgi:hypothetical protein
MPMNRSPAGDRRGVRYSSMGSGPGVRSSGGDGRARAHADADQIGWPRLVSAPTSER